MQCHDMRSDSTEEYRDFLDMRQYDSIFPDDDDAAAAAADIGF